MVIELFEVIKNIIIISVIVVELPTENYLLLRFGH